MDQFETAKTPLKKDSRLLAPLYRAYNRFLKIRGRPREIARGFALGLFIGMTPFMGLHTAIAIALAALFKWNKISAAIAVWITNALTAPIIYSLTYVVGARIAGIERAFGLTDTNGFSGLYKLILNTPEIFWAMTIGGIVLGIPLAVIGYYFTYSVIRKYQEGIRIKLAKSKEKLAHKREARQKKRHKRHRLAASPQPHLAERQRNPNYHSPPDN